MVHVRFGLQRIEEISEHVLCRIVEIGTMNNGLEFALTVRIEVIDIERIVVLMNSGLKLCFTSSMTPAFIFS